MGQGRGVPLVQSRHGALPGFEAHDLAPLWGWLGAFLSEILSSCTRAEIFRLLRIQLSFVFGSIAEGKTRAESDVGLRKITELLSGVSEKIGREINPHIMTMEEFQKRVKTGEHFITRMVSSQKLFIIGAEHDFETWLEKKHPEF